MGCSQGKKKCPQSNTFAKNNGGALVWQTDEAKRLIENVLKIWKLQNPQHEQAGYTLKDWFLMQRREYLGHGMPSDAAHKIALRSTRKR